MINMRLRCYMETAGLYATSPLRDCLSLCYSLLQDFFKSPGAKDGLRVTLTPKSAKAKTPAAPGAQEAAPASAAKSVPRTAGRSRLSQVGGAEPGAAELERTQEVAVPAEVLEAAAAPAVSSAKKQPPSASRRRSLSRTPGTKIVIVERGTQTTPKTTPGPTSAKRAAAASQVLEGEVAWGVPCNLFVPAWGHSCSKLSQDMCPPPLLCCPLLSSHTCRLAGRARPACCPPSLCRQRRRMLGTMWSRSNGLRVAVTTARWTLRVSQLGGRDVWSKNGCSLNGAGFRLHMMACCSPANQSQRRQRRRWCRSSSTSAR